MQSKKSQVWYTDFMVGVLIFFIVIIIYYDFAYGFNQDSGEITSDLMMDAKAISSSLITKGSPENWNESNVKTIGITDGKQRIVYEKLSRFGNLSYGFSKTKLRTPYDYYFYLEYPNGTRISFDGKESVGSGLNKSKNVVSIDRIVIYDSKLARMVVKVWD